MDEEGGFGGEGSGGGCAEERQFGKVVHFENAGATTNDWNSALWFSQLKSTRIMNFPYFMNTLKKNTASNLLKSALYESGNFVEITLTYAYADVISTKFPDDQFRIVICHESEKAEVSDSEQLLLDDSLKYKDDKYLVTKPFPVDELKGMLTRKINLRYVTLIRKQIKRRIEKTTNEICADAFISKLKGNISSLSELDQAVKFLA